MLTPAPAGGGGTAAWAGAAATTMLMGTLTTRAAAGTRRLHIRPSIPSPGIDNPGPAARRSRGLAWPPPNPCRMQPRPGLPGTEKVGQEGARQFPGSSGGPSTAAAGKNQHPGEAAVLPSAAGQDAAEPGQKRPGPYVPGREGTGHAGFGEQRRAIQRLPRG
jgi:hypothetical protein